MIHVDYRDARPIYEQIQDGLRRLMVAGALRPGDRLPSVRTLAASLAINPNTIQRAYETPVMWRRRVDLPAPLGPKRP